MAKDNNSLEGPSSSSSSSSRRSSTSNRNAPYDPNNSFVRKVATKVSDLMPQNSWISKWFNNSHDEEELQASEDNDQYQDKLSQPPPSKRPCIRMDVTHPPGTFSIKRTNRNLAKAEKESKEQQSNHNDTAQDFLEPSTAGQRLHNFVSSTPAFPISKTHKIPDTRPTLNILMSERSNGTANGTDNNSESGESTSGCSSLIPQNKEAPSNISHFSSSFGSKRRYIDEKLSFTNHLQSSRSLFLDSSTRETLSSRQPSFNAGLATSNALERSSSLTSPFYMGNTMFGGANAANLYRRSNSTLSDSLNLQAPKRTSVQVKPSENKSEMDSSVMSHTARKILETLEQFSSPLTDAKKMPVRNIMSPSVSRKRAREEETSTPKIGLRHLTRELNVPTVPDILRLRRKQRLQNTTANARKIMNARSNSGLLPATQEYHLRIDEEVEEEKEMPQRNLLKAKKKSKLDEEETVEAVNLPSVALPITNLPRFDFALPQSTKPSTPSAPAKSLEPVTIAKPSTPQNRLQNKDDSFQFASPIKFNENAKNLETINDFTFSKPITPSKMTSGNVSMNESHELSRTLSVESNDTMNRTSSFPNFMWTAPTSTTIKMKEKDSKFEEKKSSPMPKVASELKKGASVMDYFAQKPVVVEEDTDRWECNECLIKNSGKSTNCTSCKSPRHRQDSSDDIEIIDGSDDDDIQEIPMKKKKSSEVSKPTYKSRPSINQINSKLPPMKDTFMAKDKQQPFSNSLSSVTPNKVGMPVSNSPLFNALKSQKPTWECPCCMVRNPESASTCPCCNTAKPGSFLVSPSRTKTTTETVSNNVTNKGSGFGDMFKKPEGTWTCDTCMVPNKANDVTCAACQTPKPGAAPASNTTSMPTIKSSFGDQFKKPEGTWTCDTCMVPNKPDVSKCISCETPKPGSSTSKSNLQFKCDMPANAGSFKFGVDKADASPGKASSTLPKTNGFSFGNTSNTPAPATGFSFGIPSTKKDETPATVQFGIKPANDKEAEKSNTTGGFSFGAQKSDALKPAESGFVFGATSSTEKKEEKTDSTTMVKPASTGFSFGTSTPAAVPAVSLSNDTSANKETPSSTQSTTLPTANFMFNPSKSTTLTVTPKENETTKSTEAKEEPAKPVLNFGGPTTTDSPKPAMPQFSFGSNAKNENNTSTASFNFSAQPKPSETGFGGIKPFSFGQSAEKATPQNETKTPTLTFGNAGATAATPNFSASTSKESLPSLFGNATPAASSTENKQPMFGSTENKTIPSFGSTPSQQESKLPAFGSTSDKPASGGFAATFNAQPSTTPSLFGNANPLNTTVSAAPSFGATNTSTTTGMFGGPAKPADTSAPTPGLFTFGQSSAQAPSASFNFSAGSNTKPSAPSTESKNLFTFGASSNIPVGNGFGSTTTPANSFGTPAATPSFSFNAPAKTDGFGQTPAQNSLFSGAAATNSFSSPAPASTGFNFGGASAPAANSGFNFGGSSAPSSGGFNFNAPGSTGGPIAFDPNAQPTFNFTAGSGGAPPAFNAQPARKIKKAVRRISRQ
ncbi:nuclear pore complex protein Nup153 [Trichogramma pretiosum]|uniref:nuclear pore complex protein Nup153 n=1 Tax=Trichogramma pretiosum TaxID=7493 RepID=UPI0006C9DE99|nr:nuclear pore complex protein Nup153 [Trichogramma pretiosum]